MEILSTDQSLIVACRGEDAAVLLGDIGLTFAQEAPGPRKHSLVLDQEISSSNLGRVCDGLLSDHLVQP